MFFSYFVPGVAETQVTYLPDGGVVVMYPTNMSINIESGGHPVLSNQHRMHFKRKIIGPNKLVHKLEWRFYARRRYSPSCGRKTLQRLGSKMRVGESRPHVSMSDSPDIGFSRGEAKALRVCPMFLLCHLPHSRPCRHSNGGEGCYKYFNGFMNMQENKIKLWACSNIILFHLLKMIFSY